MASEPEAVAARYARRDASADAALYSLYGNAAALQAQQERLRAMVAMFQAHGWHDLAGRSILEVGCGTGGNLLDLLRLGATPACLTGLELLPARAALARQALPPATGVVEGDACRAPIPAGSQDAVLAFTLLSSLLEPGFRQEMAHAMWRWVAPGGGVLVYDLVVDNPRNPDVAAVPLALVRALFPEGELRSRRLTLAPPLARRLPSSWIAPAAQLLRPLRTHRLTWVVKPR